MRTEEVVSASIWLAKVGRLISTEKIKSDTAIERIVRIVLRLVRSRFLKIRVRYFVIFTCSGLCRNLERGSRFCGCAAFFHSSEYTLVQAVNGVHETLGTRVVGDHHNSLVKLCLELRQQD